MNIKNPANKNNVNWYRVHPGQDEEKLTDNFDINVEKGIGFYFLAFLRASIVNVTLPIYY